MEVKYVEKRYLRSHLRTELGTILSRVNPCFQRKISTLRFCNLRESSLLNSQLPIQASASSVTVNTDRLAPESDHVFKACTDVETVQATTLHVSNSEGVSAIGDNLSEAQIVQEVVNELIDNVIEAVEAKVPVVKEILHGIHMEGDKLNDKAHECMLEWDNFGSINPEAASKAEITQEVGNELIDNVTATVEARPTVVRETLNALHLEGDKLNGTAHECMLELDNESAINYPKAVSETVIIQDVVNELVDNVTATVEAKAPVVRETSNALHLEGDKFNGTTLEFMLDCDNDSAINPEAASEAEIIQEVVNELIDNVTATVEAKAPVVRETSNALHLEGDKFNGTTLEFMLDCDNDSAINPEAASEAEIIQEVVNELIDNVTATVEAKAPVVRETLNALHLDDNKLNGTAHECMLEWDNESAINYPEAVSEVEIIQEVVNELVDVTATVEVKATVVRETSNALHLEDNELNSTAHECMLELDNESAINYPKVASETEIIQDVVNELIDYVTATVEAKAPVVRETLNALHLDDNKLNGTAHECMLEWDNESAINYPEAVSEVEIIQEVVNELVDVTATVEVKATVVRETSNALHLEDNELNSTAHECMLELDNESAMNYPKVASETEIIQDVVNELVDNVTATVEAKAPVGRETANALHLEGDKLNGTTLEFMLDCDNKSAINPEAASEAEIIQEVVNELIDNVTATVEVKAPVVRETLNVLHLEGDKLNGTAHESMLEWDNESAINYPEAASEAEIIQNVVNELVDVTATVETKAPVVRETSDGPHLEGDKFNGTTLELMLQCDNDIAVNPEAASEAETIQEIVNELIDNVTATVEAKAPVVRETLNALHLEGDKLNGTAHECKLERDNESAIHYPKPVSEAEIIQEIVNELIDNVTATVEVKAPVVRETLNALHLEGDKFNATTLEFMLEWDDEGAIQQENATDSQISQGVINSLVDNVVKLETQGVPVVLKSFNESLNDLSVEDDKLNGTAHECTLEWETVGVFEPQTASEAESVNAVTERNYQEEVVSCVAHEFSAAKVKNSAVCKSFPDFAIELESVGGVTEIPLEEEIVNVTAQDLTADERTSSVSELESITKAEDIASAAETIQAVLSELNDLIELESDNTVVFECASETLTDIPAEVDMPSSVIHEFTLEWEDVRAIEPERADKFQSVTEVTETFEKEEVFSDVEHEFSPAEVKSRTVSGLDAPELAFDSQRESATADIFLEMSHFVKITHESVPAKKDSAFFSDGSNQMENGKDDATIYDEEVHAAEGKTGNIISNESSLELKSVSEIVQFPLRIKTVTHQLTPELQLVSL